MRSTAAETQAFRSQYAQQREREASGQNYRDYQVRDTQVNGFGREFYEKENRYPSPPRYDYRREASPQRYDYRREPSPVRTTYVREPIPHGLPPRTFVSHNKVIDIQTTILKYLLISVKSQRLL